MNNKKEESKANETIINEEKEQGIFDLEAFEIFTSNFDDENEIDDFDQD